MIIFEKTTHLSAIMEKSEIEPVIIFKHSSKCYQSDVVKNELKKAKQEIKINKLIFIVVVQDSPILSKKIEEVFRIKHESPQVIIIYKNKVILNKKHDQIKIDDLVK